MKYFVFPKRALGVVCIITALVNLAKGHAGDGFYLVLLAGFSFLAAHLEKLDKMENPK